MRPEAKGLRRQARGRSHEAKSIREQWRGTRRSVPRRPRELASSAGAGPSVTQGARAAVTEVTALMPTQPPKGPPLLGAALRQALRIAHTAQLDRICEEPTVHVPRMHVNPLPPG